MIVMLTAARLTSELSLRLTRCRRLVLLLVLVLLLLFSSCKGKDQTPAGLLPDPPDSQMAAAHWLAFERPAVVQVLLSTLTCVIAGDLPFLPVFARNVNQQFDCPRTQLLIAVYVPAVLEEVRRVLASVTCPFRLVLFREDPGLYESWDVLIQHYALAPLVSSAALDDRRLHHSLRAAVSVLHKEHSVAVVSFAVKVSYEGTRRVENWWTHPAVPHRTRLSASMLVKTATDGSLIGSENLPHCAPVWRRALHDTYGAIASRFGPCSDYAFFLRLALGGETLLHLSRGAPGVHYLLRQHSHNRRSREANTSCEDIIFDAYGMRSLGLYNNLHFQHARLAPLVSKSVAVVLDMLQRPEEVDNNRLLQLLDFLVLNGHRVTVFASFASHVSSWQSRMTRFGVEFTIGKVMRGVCYGFHLTFAFLPFTTTGFGPLEHLIEHGCHHEQPIVVINDFEQHRPPCLLGKVSCVNIHAREQAIYSIATLVITPSNNTWLQDVALIRLL